MLTQRRQGLYRLFPPLPDPDRRRALLVWRLGIGNLLLARGELTWRRYSIYCAMLVIGLLGESLNREGSKTIFSSGRTSASASTRPSPDFRQHRRARFLPRRNQGLLYFATFLLQLSPLALHRAPLLSPFPARISRARYVSPRRKNAPRRVDREGRPVAWLAAAQSRYGFADSRHYLRRTAHCTEDKIPVLGGAGSFPQCDPGKRCDPGDHARVPAIRRISTAT